MNNFERIKTLKSLKNQSGILVCDSLKVTRKVVDSEKFKPIHLYYQEGLEIDLDLIKIFPSVDTLNKEEFSEIKGQHFHKGVISIFQDVDPAIISDLNQVEGPFVILNGVTSPENVGSIIRTVAGLGFKSLVLDQKSCHPHNRRVIRVSMGNFVYLNLYTCRDLKTALTNSRREVYATANDSNAIGLLEWSPKPDSGFIIGSEGHGIDTEIKKACTQTVKIPVNEKVQHLNAGHACAIISSRYLN